mmetsp:Transcript_18914/g.56184  ORF Transcript_18914/g.56184 Transcript_18914/m.56184 type:complete len:101 (-) Transcript_18914:1211-1513(-)
MAVDLSSYGGLEPEHKARILKMSDISLETITKRYTLGAELGRCALPPLGHSPGPRCAVGAQRLRRARLTPCPAPAPQRPLLRGEERDAEERRRHLRRQGC